MNKELLKENRIHGDIMYPLSVYSVQCQGSNILDCHWHEELEFLMVTEGKAVFQVDTSYYEVFAGEAVFINSGEIHAGYPLNHSSCSFSAIVFKPELLYSNTFDILQEKYIEPLLKRQYSFSAHLKGIHGWEKEILELLSRIIQSNEQKHDTYELITKANLYLILSNICANCRLDRLYNSNTENNYKVERLKTVLNYVHTNYSEKISLKDLAALVNMSEGHFCRFFKQMVHRTPVDYLNYFRMRKAAQLLESSSNKISEIAGKAGFDNLSYFVIIFKQYMGCTPSAYRRKYHNEFGISCVETKKSGT